MDLPVSSFVSHSSLLTANSVDFMIAHMASLCNGNRPYLNFVIVAILIAEVLFKQFLIHTAV